MKKLLLAIVILLATTMSAYALDVTLEWDANTEPNIGGYRIYKGTSAADVIKNAAHRVGDVVPAQDTNPDPIRFRYTVTGLPNVDTWFAVTAYDTETPPQESGLSNIVMAARVAPPPPAPPQNLSIWERIYSWLMRLFGRG